MLFTMVVQTLFACLWNTKWASRTVNGKCLMSQGPTYPKTYCEQSFGSALDAIWAIWSYFVVFNSTDNNSKGSGRCLKDFDQCVSMTDMVLTHGCDIQDTIGYSAKANALFEMSYYWPMDRADPLLPAKALDYLIGIGYELEQKNQEGQTPFLWTTSAYQPQVIKCLRVFIERKANVHATDRAGRGALHCALLAPHILEGWKSKRLMGRDVPISEFYYLPSHHYHTEDTSHAEDYVHHELHSITGPTGIDDTLTFSVEPERLEPLQINLPAGGTSALEDQEALGYVVSKDINGNEAFIQDPVKVLKTRMMFKLLTILGAGCDPNMLDLAGLTPSDYARRDGLWTQWIWALENSGYEYEVRNDRWIKKNGV